MVQHEEIGLWEGIFSRSNLFAALERVTANGGAPGVDGMTVEELPEHLKAHWASIRDKLEAGTYQPSPVRRVEIPKPGGGVRLIGIPTVQDRLIQQAMHQKLIDMRENGRSKLVQQLLEELLSGAYRPQPVKRVYIPKANGKKRPLGIATIRDRVAQATVKMILEPIYESVFHPFSWGFRPLRSTHHALSAVRRGPCDPRTGFKWIIEGDIAACFDKAS